MFEKLVRAAVTRDHRCSSNDKEIEMTRQSRLRFGAKLLAVTCLAVGIGASASVSGSPSAEASAGKIAKMARKGSCPRRSVCLYSNADFGGKRVRYNCWGWAPGSHRSTLGDSVSDATFKRTFPWNRDGGVSSYVNNGVPSASLQTQTPEGGFGQPGIRMNSRGNLGPSNDLVTGLYMIC
jgi:Peptidase inhibitor family I36